MNFHDLGLSESLCKRVERKGYTEPTPIQQAAIPAILDGQDVLAAAQTGTGKTAGFTLPILQRLQLHRNQKPQPQVLILTPTRELAQQVSDNVSAYGKDMHMKLAVIYGGVGIHPQIAHLRRGVHVIIATPGRLLDLMNQGHLKLNTIQTLVLDEADRMLDMGFLPDVKRIIGQIPNKPQTLLFSATFDKQIRALAQQFLVNPVEIEITPRNSTTDLVNQRIVAVNQADKYAALEHLIAKEDRHQVLVFSKTKYGSDKLVKQLENSGISSAAIHGNKSQSQRQKALRDFTQGRVRVLVGTDVAARGIDIKQLPHVINYDLPLVAEDYVHRIGRTGRAGNKGEALSLVTAPDLHLLRNIEKLTSQQIETITIDELPPKDEAVSRRHEQRSSRSNSGAPRRNRGRRPQRRRRSS